MTAAKPGISYLDGPRLRRSLLAAADWVDTRREELNRINVFPVPDGDTGTNFCATMRAVAISVREVKRRDMPAVTKAMAEACVFSARGNSGMLLSHFLLGFRDKLGDRQTASTDDVALALRAGADRLYQSIDEPVEGTILTVCRAVADAGEMAATRTENLAEFMRNVLDGAREALAKTPELLASLKDAGVVDAGGQGFVFLLEGVMKLIDGDPIVAAAGTDTDFPAAASLAEVETDRDYRFCTEVLVRGNEIPANKAIRHALRPLGASIVVLETGNMLKIHIHTNTPGKVYALVQTWGTLESTKADDMREQHQGLHTMEKEVSVVVDSSCDLPDEVIDRRAIIVVPLQVIDGDNTYLDGVDPETEKIYQKMREGTVFTTSQPTPGSFAEAYTDARQQAGRVFSPILSRGLSGTFNSARVAAQKIDEENIYLYDSCTASLGLGMLTLRAVELADQGLPNEEIARRLDVIRKRSGMIFTVDIFENLLRSGRVGRGKAWLGSLLDIKPILTLNREGKIVPEGNVRGRQAVLPRVIELLKERLTPRPNRLRIGIVHADAVDAANEAKAAIVDCFHPTEILMGPITPAIGVHLGPGAWGVFYQVEDDDREQ